jgi:hypothetical protein
VAERAKELIAREGYGPAEAVVQASNDVPDALSDAEPPPPAEQPEAAAAPTAPPPPETRPPVVTVTSRTFASGAAQLEATAELPDEWPQGREADAQAEAGHAKWWSGFREAADALEAVRAYRKLRSRLADARRRVEEADAAVLGAEDDHRQAVTNEMDVNRAWVLVQKCRSRAEGVAREMHQLAALADAALPKAEAALRQCWDAQAAARQAELDAAEGEVMERAVDALTELCAEGRAVEEQRRRLRSAAEDVRGLIA